MPKSIRIQLGLVLCAALLSASGRVAHAKPEEACVIVDTDFDIDDMMAIPQVLQNHHVAVIVTTEGATTASLGATALAHLLGHPGDKSPVPILIGATPDPNRGYTPPPWLASIRTAMERANGFIPSALPPAASTGKLEDQVAHAVRHCPRIEVLAIGPWTSFVRYSPRIASRIVRVVAQGRPLHSAAEGDYPSDFNCAYDLASCTTAFGQMAKMNPVWVDVLEKMSPPMIPTMEMVTALRPDGLPGALKAALMATPATWGGDQPAGASPVTYLWDQSAGLFLLRPDLFHLVGAHMEAAVPASQIQQTWTTLTNGH